MTQKEIEKIECVLLERYAIHEADYILSLITDKSKSTEDVKKFIRYVDECNKNDIDTDIDDYNQMTIKEFMMDYCARNGLIFRDNVGYTHDAISGIKHDADQYIVRKYKVHTYFRYKGYANGYKAITKDGYLILV